MVKIKLSSVFILAAFVIAPIAAIPLPSSSTPTHPGTGDAHHDTNPADHQWVYLQRLMIYEGYFLWLMILLLLYPQVRIRVTLVPKMLIIIQQIISEYMFKD